MEDITNHTTYGRVLAQQNDGNIEAYKSQLIKLKEATQTNSGLEQQKVLDKISGLKQLIVKYQGEILNRVDPTNGRIKLLEEEERKLNEQIYEVEKDSSKAEKYSTFNLSRLIIYLLFIVPLSFYLIFYYTAIAKSVFNGLSPDSIIDGENLSLPILPDFQELSDALKTNFMLILVPFVFFGFGLALHIITESTNKNRILFLATIIAVVLAADSSMAYLIHNQALIALSMIMDRADIETFIELTWYLDINFYIILILGFVVFGIWSIIFHAILVEWSKRNVVRVLMTQVRALGKKINEARAEIGEYQNKIDQCEEELKNLNNQINPGATRLIQVIEAFTTGWIDFLRSKKQDDLEDRINEVMNYKESFLKTIANPTNGI